MKKTILLLFFIAFSWSVPDLDAQFLLEGQVDLGNNNLSNGIYLHFSGIGYYDNPHWGAQAGFQLGLVQSQNVFLNSWYGSSYGKLYFDKIRLDIGGGYLWTAFSPDMREINWIIFAKTYLKRWDLALGNNSRIYRLSHKSADDDNLAEPESKIIEGWNLMYSVGFRFRPLENRWNIMFTVTDYDRFLIQQETNPMVNIRFDYEISKPLGLYSELWYNSCGLVNGMVNYFGTFIRIGVLWEP